MKQLSQEYLIRLAQEVEAQKDQGMTIKQIADKLRVPLVWVKTSQKRYALQNQEQKEQDRKKFRLQIVQL